MHDAFVLNVPMLLVLCAETGDFGDIAQTFAAYGKVPPAWPLTQPSFQSWASTAGMAAEDADAAWRLYSPVAAPRQKWYQIGNDLTLFCGLRAAVEAEAKTPNAAPIYLSLFTTAVAYTRWGETKYAAEGIDIYLTWGQTAATTTMGVELPEEAKAVGDAMRSFLVGFARTGTLGGLWQPFPAICEIGEELACSTENRHAQACALFDRAIGRKYDIALGR